MRIDPRAPRGRCGARRRAHGPGDPTVDPNAGRPSESIVGPARAGAGRTADALAVCAELSDLAGWPPVAERVAEVHEALAGTGGMTVATWRRLTLWADRWPRVSPGLRAFYAAEAPEDQTASVVLFALLEGQRRPDGRRLAALRERWADRYGAEPAHDCWETV